MVSPTSRISNISTLSDAFACITELCNSHNYNHFIMAHLPEVGDSIVADDIVLTNLPLYMVDDLVAMRLLGDSAILTELQYTSAPFSWTPTDGIGSEIPSHEVRRQNTKQSQSQSSADLMFVEELETKFAHCFQTATRGPRRLFMVFFSSSENKHALDPSLTYSVQLISDQVETLTGQRMRNPSLELNKRELECLDWAAAGKTSGEIALIVTLSEHTVNHYLNSCCKKLDCVNRTQAVAKAVRLGIIQ